MAGVAIAVAISGRGQRGASTAANQPSQEPAAAQASDLPQMRSRKLVSSWSQLSKAERRELDPLRERLATDMARAAGSDLDAPGAVERHHLPAELRLLLERNNVILLTRAMHKALGRSDKKLREEFSAYLDRNPSQAGLARNAQLDQEMAELVIAGWVKVRDR